MPEDNHISGAGSSGIEVIGKSRVWNPNGAAVPSEFAAICRGEMCPEDISIEAGQVIGNIANNRILGNGRGVLLQDVPAIIEGNTLAANNGWSIHMDLRFLGRPEHRSAMVGNTVVAMKNKKGQTVPDRSIRLSMPEPGCSFFPGVLPKISENLQENGHELLPLVKRRRLE